MSRRPRSSEAVAWIFMRLSGLALVFLALVHFAVTHIINDVVATDSDFVARRWENPAWRGFDWLLLALALAHGANGVRGIIDDSIQDPRWRRAVKVTVFGLAGGLFLLGTATVVAYAP